ncbi:Putative transmembrane protein [Roseibacterium elongatum DSM 19469]|uniref:Putative transmembrane protein n=1 Tax=Roseicyclus elongatus DSM 19469 TaxID=1294273 RepID=W8RUQ7_9RHOB|nr:DUF924 family protein [Roseibacterium elongatum]AHM04919.1 Putative transmembrane protein [Roseibacterium elongatum DSM 19469]
MTDRADEVLAFWQGAGPEKWYKKDDAFDAQIRAQFETLWEAAAGGALDEIWATNAQGALALIVLLDQFPRNMFRDDGRAFASDDRARSIACYAIERGWDLRVDGPMRQFFYLPFMHSERLTDQDHCVRLMAERMAGTDNLLHARAHREIIRRFNRFPYRNAALGRVSTDAERAFLENGGYGAILSEVQAA